MKKQWSFSAAYSEKCKIQVFFREPVPKACLVTGNILYFDLIYENNSSYAWIFDLSTVEFFHKPMTI